MDILTKADAIGVLKIGKETYGMGKQTAIEILNEWDCTLVHLVFPSKKSVTITNPDTGEDFTLTIMDTVH